VAPVIEIPAHVFLIGMRRMQYKERGIFYTDRRGFPESDQTHTLMTCHRFRLNGPYKTRLWIDEDDQGSY
jgi:hypothetical protein